MQAEPVLQSDRTPYCRRRMRRGFVASVPGSALITALVFTVIIALALAGIGTLTVSHYNLANVEAASSDALDMAEAGINWELYKLTNNGIASADTSPTTYNASPNIANGLSGTFTVSCATLDGSALNANTKEFTITCTGTIRTVGTTSARRSVRVNARPYSTFYTLYSNSSTNFTGDYIDVEGIAGSNGKQSIDASVGVKPKVSSLVFNGNKAPSDATYDGYTMVSNPKALAMQGVTDMVNSKFPGGAEYLKHTTTMTWRFAKTPIILPRQALLRQRLSRLTNMR